MLPPCLQPVCTEVISKPHIKDCFKNNGKQMFKILKKREYVTFKIFERNIKLPSMIYAEFESVLVPEDNGKQNSEESYTAKHKKHVACSYGYKLVCADYKLCKPFKSALDEKSSNNIVEESKKCSEVMEKHFNKKLIMTKEDDSTKCWICDNVYIEDDIKVRYYYHITRKYIRLVHRDCNINVKLNYKIPIVFHNLKNYDSYLTISNEND